MPRRILICIEDTGVAHVVAARLMKDGADGVVVQRPSDLVQEAKEGAVALVVQDKYPSGEAGASLLRQVRVARGEPVAGVYLLTGELADADKSVLAKQYKVREFLAASASPHQIASALLEAGAGVPGDGIELDLDDDVVLHEDEVKNDFDIEIASRADEIPVDEIPADSFDGDSGAMTVEVSLRELGALNLGGDSQLDTDLPTRRVHDEVTRGNPLMQQAVTRLGDPDNSLASFDDIPRTQEGASVEMAGMTLDNAGLDLDAAETGLMELTLPVPGSSRDLELPLDSQTGGATTDGVAAMPLELSLDQLVGGAGKNAPAPGPIPDSAGSEMATELVPAGLVAEALAASGLDPAASQDPLLLSEPEDGEEADVLDLEELTSMPDDDEDEMQVQQLKKALLQKKRELESAQKKIEDLEEKVKAGGSAKDALPGDEVPSEGVVEDLRYPALLARCRGEAFSGSIRLQLAGDVTRTIYIRDGLPVAFATSEQGDKIGKVLVAQGRISDDQYVKAATRMVERGIKLSEALVDLGLVDAETLEVEVRNLTRDQIIAGFELTQGRFTTTRDDRPHDSIPTFDFGPGEIYVQGYRQYAPKAEMHAHYESLRPKYLRANARLASFRPKLGLGGDDERLIRLLGEAYTVEEAVERAKIEPDAVARLIAALQALELVEEWSPGVEQFRARLTSERQHYMEEIARIREESAKREKQLFEGFERALSKIGSVMGAPAPSMAAVSTQVASKAQPPPPENPDSAAAAKTAVIEVPKESVTVSPPPPEPPKATVTTVASGSSSSNGSPQKPKSGLVLMDPALLGNAATPADEKFHEAIRQAAEDRLDEAEVTLREAVRMDATRPEFLVSLARVLLANPRYERAGTLPVVRSLLDRAVQLSPDDPDATRFHKEIVAEMGQG